MYRPPETDQMVTPMMVYKIEEVYELGVLVKKKTPVCSIFCNFKTYGGTEKEVNGVIAVEDTATITTWYNPEIKSNGMLKRLTDGAEFEILGEPEDMEQRRMVMRFKIRRIKGGS